MKRIPLTQGKFALVDDADFDKLNKFSWYYHKVGKSEYARMGVQANNKQTRTFMHRLILGIKSCELVDHVDANGLNNQRANLRLCNPSQNIAGKRMSKNNTSGFKGVFYDKRDRKFLACIHPKKKYIIVGRFNNAIDAALAYDSAAIKHFGNFSRTNQQMGLLPSSP